MKPHGNTRFIRAKCSAHGCEKAHSWLNRAFEADYRINLLQQQIKQETALLKEAKECNISDSEAEEALRLVMEEHRKALCELLKIRPQIEKAIADSDTEEEEKEILTRFYLLYETNEKIAEEMFYDLRTIPRKHKKALEKFVIPEQY